MKRSKLVVWMIVNFLTYLGVITCIMLALKQSVANNASISYLLYAASWTVFFLGIYWSKWYVTKWRFKVDQAEMTEHVLAEAVKRGMIAAPAQD